MKNFLRIFTILTRKQMIICSFIIFLMVLCAIMEAFGIGLVYPLIRIMLLYFTLTATGGLSLPLRFLFCAFICSRIL